MNREDGHMNILSLDFGGSSVKYGLVTQDGVVSDTGKCPAPLGSVDEFQDTVRSLAEEFRGRAQGIDVSIPGHVDSEKGIMLGTGVYRQLHGKNIRRLAEKASALPVRVENDGNCGALSEVWKGQLQDCRDGAVIILGSAIGGGHCEKWANSQWQRLLRRGVFLCRAYSRGLHPLGGGIYVGRNAGRYL